MGKELKNMVDRLIETGSCQEFTSLIQRAGCIGDTDEIKDLIMANLHSRRAMVFSDNANEVFRKAFNKVNTKWWNTTSAMEDFEIKAVDNDDSFSEMFIRVNKGAVGNTEYPQVWTRLMLDEVTKLNNYKRVIDIVNDRIYNTLGFKQKIDITIWIKHMDEIKATCFVTVHYGSMSGLSKKAIGEAVFRAISCMKTRVLNVGMAGAFVENVQSYYGDNIKIEFDLRTDMKKDEMRKLLNSDMRKLHELEEALRNECNT